MECYVTFLKSIINFSYSHFTPCVIILSKNIIKNGEKLITIRYYNNNVMFKFKL